MGSLDGKVALVTGGARGIGQGIVRRFIADGAKVAFTYSKSKDRAEALAEELGDRAFALKGDSVVDAELIGAVKAVVDHFGGLDILVNNAGVYSGAPLQELSVEEIDSRIALNVRAVVLGTRAALEFLPDGGRIITIASIAALRSPVPGGSLYSLTKAAVTGFSRGLVRELGPRGITVNLVHPGPIDTDMNPADADFAAPVAALTALGRYGKPSDVAAAVAFLASPEAAYVTGAELVVDGGSAV